MAAICCVLCLCVEWVPRGHDGFFLLSLPSFGSSVGDIATNILTSHKPITEIIGRHNSSCVLAQGPYNGLTCSHKHVLQIISLLNIIIICVLKLSVCLCLYILNYSYNLYFIICSWSSQRCRLSYRCCHAGLFVYLVLILTFFLSFR